MSLDAGLKLDVLAAVSSEVGPMYPKGDACIGVEVALDFGGDHGICSGKIVSADTTTSKKEVFAVHHKKHIAKVKDPCPNDYPTQP